MKINNDRYLTPEPKICSSCLHSRRCYGVPPNEPMLQLWPGMPPMAFCQACYDKGEKFVVDEMYKYIVAERWHQICPAVRDSIGELRGFEATKEALVAEMDERMKKVPLSEPIHDIPLTGEVVILESHGVGIFFLPLKEEAL